MSSAKSATTNADAVRALRVGVIGAGVMGTNHARVHGVRVRRRRLG